MATAASLRFLLTADAARFTKGLKSAETSVRSLQSAATSTAKTLKGFGAFVGIGVASRAMRQFTKQLESIDSEPAKAAVESIKQLKAVGAPIMEGLAPAIKVAADGFRFFVTEVARAQEVATWLGKAITDNAAIIGRAVVVVGGLTLAYKAWTMATKAAAQAQAVLAALTGDWKRLAIGGLAVVGALWAVDAAFESIASSSTLAESQAAAAAASLDKLNQAADAERFTKWQQAINDGNAAMAEFGADLDKRIRQFDMTEHQKELDDLISKLSKMAEGTGQQFNPFGVAEQFKGRFAELEALEDKRKRLAQFEEDFNKQQKKDAEQLAAVKKKAADDEKRRQKETEDAAKRLKEAQLDAAKSIADSVTTPLEQFKKRVEEIQALRKAGAFEDDKMAQRALVQAETDFRQATASPINREQPVSAVLKGSAESFNRIAAFEGKMPEKNTQELIKEQVKLARENVQVNKAAVKAIGALKFEDVALEKAG